MKRNPVGWFEIYVSNIQRAKAFYEGVFQTQLEKLGEHSSDFEMWAFPGSPEAGGATGTLCKMKGYEPGKNSVLIYFSCLDCAVEEKKVREFGGKVEKPKMSIGEYGFISIVMDTEGNRFSLHSMS